VAYETTLVVTSGVVSLEYFTETMTLTTIATRAMIRTEQVGFTLEQSSSSIVAVVLLVTISLVVAIVLWRRGREKPVGAAESSVPVISQLAAKRFCINCGTQLPAEVKFCNKCGSKQ
jgi:ribosomal protein L40E